MVDVHFTIVFGSETERSAHEFCGSKPSHCHTDIQLEGGSNRVKSELICMFYDAKNFYRGPDLSFSGLRSRDR